MGYAQVLRIYQTWPSSPTRRRGWIIAQKSGPSAFPQIPYLHLTIPTHHCLPTRKICILVQHPNSNRMRARLAVTSASTILSNPRAIRCSSSRTAATTATSPPQQAEAGKPHAHLRQYLDAWMGSTGTLNTTRSTTTGPVASHQHHHPHPSSAGHPITLTVAGKSYLVPTLRLPRGVGPLDLQAGLKATTSLSAGYFKCAPIVVDLGEWMTSQPLPRGGVRTEAAGKGGEVLDAVLLGEFVETLREAGLQPVGIANATATDIQAAAMALGLPCFMGRHGGNGINSSNSPGSAAAPANAAAPAAAMTPSTARPARKPTMAAAHLPSTSPRSEAPKPSTSPTSPNAATISSQPLSPPSPSAAPILPTKVKMRNRQLKLLSRHLHETIYQSSLSTSFHSLPGNPRQCPYWTTSSGRRCFSRHSGTC